MTEQEHRSVFVSYSWSSAAYAERVVKLAEQLTADGIEVVLDQWDLREGQDKHQFMERAINDPSITRVLILCDPTYARKADDRHAGVGTETLIISPEVYRLADQRKFVPVIMERAEDGSIPVPTYLTDRIYIDLSDDTTAEGEYQRLVRNIYDKPQLQRPPLGTAPAYLNDEAPALSTGRALPQFKDAVTRGSPHQHGAFSDYLSRLSAAYVEHLIVDAETFDDLDERVVGSIDRFLPYRDEFLEMLQVLGRYGENPVLIDRLHTFFE